MCRGACVGERGEGSAYVCRGGSIKGEGQGQVVAVPLGFFGGGAKCHQPSLATHGCAVLCYGEYHAVPCHAHLFELPMQCRHLQSLECWQPLQYE